MRQFLGSWTNRIDAKGRVSIPAGFRALLRDGEGNTPLILRPSSHHPCIDGWPLALFDALAPSVDQIDPFDPAAEAKFRRFFGRAQEPQVDREGRMVLPPALARHAGIGDEVMFIGVGRWFQIWEPLAGEQELARQEQAA